MEAAAVVASKPSEMKKGWKLGIIPRMASVAMPMATTSIQNWEVWRAYRGDGFADVLYENPGFGHGWLAIEIVGVESNRSGIGTQLRVDVVEGGQRRSLYRWVSSGGSFGGNPLRQYVGLGSAERVAQLVVFWQKSGEEQVFDEVPSNAIIRITEGREQLEILALPSFKFNVEQPKRAEHHLHK